MSISCVVFNYKILLTSCKTEKNDKRETRQSKRDSQKISYVA